MEDEADGDWAPPGNLENGRQGEAGKPPLPHSTAMLPLVSYLELNRDVNDLFRRLDERRWSRKTEEMDRFSSEFNQYLKERRGRGGRSASEPEVGEGDLEEIRQRPAAMDPISDVRRALQQMTDRLNSN